MADIADQNAELDSLLHTWKIASTTHNDRKHEILRYAREHCPVARTEKNGGFWIVTRYDDVKSVLEDWETFSSVQPLIAPLPIDLAPISEDPPLQSELRRHLNPLFSRTAVTRFEPEMRALARGLISNWIGRGTVELISEYSAPYTAGNLAQTVFPGFGTDDLTRCEEIALRVVDHAPPEAFGDLLQVCTQYLVSVREQGIAPDGVIRRLLDARIDGEPIPDDKLIGVLCILVLGGLETTRAAIASIAYRAATTPGLEDRLRDPDWARRDLDEFLRLDSPVAALARTATRDVSLGGAQIKAGERLQIRYDSANRDSGRFPRADRLVFDTERGGNAAFGLGVHRCVGSHLARFQIKIAFEELLAQVRSLRLAPDAEITWMPSAGTRLDTLNLEFDRV